MDLVNQEVTYVRRVKEDLRVVDTMMKAVTQSHAAHIHSVWRRPLASENTQWIRAIEDRHNAVKYQAKDKMEEMGALGQEEGPPSKAVAKTQLKKSERMLRDMISGAVTNTNRLVSHQMTQAQYHKAGSLVKTLLTQVREDYRSTVSKLKAMILSEDQASKEDTTLLKQLRSF